MFITQKTTNKVRKETQRLFGLIKIINAASVCFDPDENWDLFSSLTQIEENLLKIINNFRHQIIIKK